MRLFEKTLKSRRDSGVSEDDALEEAAAAVEREYKGSIDFAKLMEFIMMLIKMFMSA